MYRIGQLQPVAAEYGWNLLFLLRCSVTISVTNCFPDFQTQAGEEKAPRRALLKALILLYQTGAGEEIRTLDPNLGKVMLYP